MELFSQPFIQAVRQVLSTLGTVVLGTIPVPKGKPLALVEEIRTRNDIKVFSVSTPGPLYPQAWSGCPETARGSRYTFGFELVVFFFPLAAEHRRVIEAKLYLCWMPKQTCLRGAA